LRWGVCKSLPAHQAPPSLPSQQGAQKRRWLRSIVRRAPRWSASPGARPDCAVTALPARRGCRSARPERGVGRTPRRMAPASPAPLRTRRRTSSGRPREGTLSLRERHRGAVGTPRGRGPPRSPIPHDAHGPSTPRAHGACESGCVPYTRAARRTSSGRPREDTLSLRERHRGAVGTHVGAARPARPSRTTRTDPARRARMARASSRQPQSSPKRLTGYPLSVPCRSRLDSQGSPTAGLARLACSKTDCSRNAQPGTSSYAAARSASARDHELATSSSALMERVHVIGSRRASAGPEGSAIGRGSGVSLLPFLESSAPTWARARFPSLGSNDEDTHNVTHERAGARLCPPNAMRARRMFWTVFWPSMLHLPAAEHS